MPQTTYLLSRVRFWISIFKNKKLIISEHDITDSINKSVSIRMERPMKSLYPYADHLSVRTQH